MEFLGVDETFFVVEFGGDRGGIHGMVHFFVHFPDLIDGSEGPFGVSQADGIEVEALCAQEVAGLVVEIFFHFGLREAEVALFEAKMIDASPIILGHGCGIVDLADGGFFSEVESDSKAEERLGLFVLLQKKQGFASVGEGVDAVFFGEVGLKESIVELEGRLPCFGFAVGSGESEAGVEGDVCGGGGLFEDFDIKRDGSGQIGFVFVGEGLVVDGGVEVGVSGVVSADGLVELDGVIVFFEGVGFGGGLVEFAQVKLLDIADLSVFCAKEHGIDIELEGWGFGDWGVRGRGGARGRWICISKGREEQEDER